MPRILIAGCGYVGARAADLFHEGGWDVQGWTSSAQSARALSSKPYPVHAVDLTDAAALKQFRGEFDAVIHCASSGGGSADTYRQIYLNGARNLQERFPDALLLFTSSTSVYAQTDGAWVTELSPAEPKRANGRILRETEEVVLQGGGIVMRVAGIYGPGRSALLRKLLAGDAVIDPTERFVNQVHRDDIASGCMLLIDRNVRGQLRAPLIFNVTDDHPMTQRACYEWLAKHLDRPVPLPAAAAEPRKRGNSNKRVSSQKLRALGWNPRYPDFETAMTESILPNLERFGA